MFTITRITPHRLYGRIPSTSETFDIAFDPLSGVKTFVMYVYECTPIRLSYRMHYDSVNCRKLFYNDYYKFIFMLWSCYE